MRVLASLGLLALLGTLACSGTDSGPRGGAIGGSGGAGGSTAVPSGGSTSSAAGAPVQTAGSTGQAGAPPVTGADTGAHVITWVPQYHIADAKLQLLGSFGDTSMADGLSYLALQFWVADGAGTRLDKVSENDVTWFHDWARQHGVKILLCVHNNTGDWNWPVAMTALKDNRDAFAAHLASQVMTRDFDGVDIDFEGIIEPTPDDQQAYVSFIQTLSNLLHPVGKALTLDSFYAQYNAPNWDFWPDLLPLVDGITSMGYEQSGMSIDYQKLVDHAAAAPQKLMVGVPSYQGTWQGNTVTEQLAWLVQQGQVGTAIWDAALMVPEWRQAGVWNQLKTIKSR
jgi:hypothetical protein